MCWSSVKTLLVKCPSVQWQPDDLTIRTKKWFLGAGFLGAPPISLNSLALRPFSYLRFRHVNRESGKNKETKKTRKSTRKHIHNETHNKQTIKSRVWTKPQLEGDPRGLKHDVDSFTPVNTSLRYVFSKPRFWNLAWANHRYKNGRMPCHQRKVSVG